MVVLSAPAIARALDGKVHGGNRVCFPTPGHSRKDRGSVLTIDPKSPDGFFVKSYNGADWRDLRLYVCQRLGIMSDFLAQQVARDKRKTAREARRERQREYARQKRLAEGATPQSESLTAKARALGVARSTLYRRRKARGPGETTP